MSRYIIGTGWWCTENEERDLKFLNGEDYIRSASFNELWQKAIIQNCNPESIVVIDSASPIKPNFEDSTLPLRIIELPINLGHATNLKNSKFCGWTASVIMSMQYASFSDAEFYVYVEQDVLLSGTGIIEKSIETMGNSDFLFGATDNYSQPLQQSFFIVRKKAIDGFLSNLNKISYTDAEIAPEVKFALATSSLFMMLPHFLFKQQFSLFGKLKRRVICWLFKNLSNYETMKFGYGRNRPINFNDDFFYFQHASETELNNYIAKEFNDESN